MTQSLCVDEKCPADSSRVFQPYDERWSRPENGEGEKGSAAGDEPPETSRQRVNKTGTCEDSSSEHPVPVIQIIPLIRGSVSTMIDVNRNRNHTFDLTLNILQSRCGVKNTERGIKLIITIRSVKHLVDLVDIRYCLGIHPQDLVVLTSTFVNLTFQA